MDDWRAIYEVLVRYADGIDRQDFGIVASCFAEDAHAVYAGNEAGGGRDAIVAYLQRAHTASASTHLVGGVRIEVDGEQAQAGSTVVAFLVKEGRVRIRGLNYVDRLVRRGGEWLIAERVHSVGWMAEAEAVV